MTGLPADVDEEEVYDVFHRFGLIAESAETNKPRIKLYSDDQGNFKGDALVGKCLHSLEIANVTYTVYQSSTASNPCRWRLTF